MESIPETWINTSWFGLPENFSQVLSLLLILGLFYVILKAIQLYRRKQDVVKILSPFPNPCCHWLYGHIKLVS